MDSKSTSLDLLWIFVGVFTNKATDSFVFS